MPDKCNLTLLWVDDQIDSLTSFTKALTDDGFTVTRAIGTNDAVEKASRERFDVCLVDIRMPAPDGIECLRRLHALVPNSKLASLSSFHYLDKYKNQLRALDFPVQLMDKDFPDALSEDFKEQFLIPIHKLATEGVTATIRDIDTLLKQETHENPFEIALVDFNRLPLPVKDRLRMQARKQVAALITKAFSEGKIWVMFCGDSNNIRAAATVPEEVYTDDQIAAFARKQQRPAFYFWNTVTSEDMWSSCGVNGQPTYYPTVTLRFGVATIDVHFDTGSPMTFFSYEELLELELVRPTGDFGSGYRNGFTDPYFAKPLHIEAILRCQKIGQSRTIKISGQAVRDWESSPFARHCNSHCPLPKDPDARSLCPDRKALVGRNLLIENALVIILDGELKKTSFKGD